MDAAGVRSLIGTYLKRKRMASDSRLAQEYLSFFTKQKIADIDAHRAAHPDGLKLDPGEQSKYDGIKMLIGSPFAGGGPDTPYYRGAGVKLYFEDTINILPTETREANKKAFRALEADQAAKERYHNASTSKQSTDEEVERLRSEMNEARQRANDLIMEGREDIALQHIADRHGEVGETNVIPLIYGGAHDFSNNLQSLSQQRAQIEQQFGLIKLTPK